MGWLTSSKVLNAFDFFIELLKILSAILILYGAILNQNFGVIGNIGMVLLGILSFALSQYLKQNTRFLINKISSPTIIPIGFGTLLEYKKGQNNLLGIVKIKGLVVKDNILTIRFSIEDDKPFYIAPEILHADGQGPLNQSEDLPNIFIRPKWKNEVFDFQYANLNSLKIKKSELEQDIELVVRILYSSYYHVYDIDYNDRLQTKIEAGKIKCNRKITMSYNRQIRM